jgi:hypothetical protein
VALSRASAGGVGFAEGVSGEQVDGVLNQFRDALGSMDGTVQSWATSTRCRQISLSIGSSCDSNNSRTGLRKCLAPHGYRDGLPQNVLIAISFLSRERRCFGRLGKGIPKRRGKVPV